MKTRHIYSLFQNIRFKTLRKRQICVYRNGFIKIEEDAQLLMNECFLFVNKCHFPTVYKPHPSMIWIERNGQFTLKSDHFTLCEGSNIHIRANAQLLIEGKGMINTMTEIDVYEKIIIGHGTIISSNCYITDSDQHDVIEKGELKPRTSPVTIGRNVWIGRNVTILKGVEIGDNSIIGAGSIVTKSIPPNTMYAGFSARKIKDDISWKF